MKPLADRIWLIILGVAVAILVTLTTVYWNEPSTTSAGSDPGMSKPAPSRAILPRIGSDISRHLVKPFLPGR